MNHRTAMIFPALPDGEVILNINTFTERSPRKYRWQVWKPKYGKSHILALTENGVYDITEPINQQIINQTKESK